MTRRRASDAATGAAVPHAWRTPEDLRTAISVPRGTGVGPGTGAGVMRGWARLPDAIGAVLAVPGCGLLPVGPLAYPG